MRATLFNQESNLNRLAASVFAVGVFLAVAVAVTGDLRWLLLTAIPALIYGWWKPDVELWKIACLLPPVYSLGFTLAKWMFTFNHRLIDSVLAHLDHGAGIAVWHWCTAHRATLLILWAAYYAMGAAMMLVLAFSDRRKEMLRSLIFASVLAVVCYWIFPAVGPRAVGSTETFCNSMPSLHLVFALLCWIYSPPKLRIPMLVFVALVVAATLGLGEHYAIDLVAALPFTAAVVLMTRMALRHHFRSRRVLGSDSATETAS